MRWLALLAGSLAFTAALAQDPADTIAVPKLSGRVVDLTGTLTAPEQSALDAKLRAFEAAKGSQVAVLLVPTIGNETIEEFAGRVTDAWQLGRKGVDDGVLFVIAKQQRKMRIHTGRGVQGVMTDALSKRILAERVAPGFRTGDFSSGINAGVDAVLKAIEGESLPPASATPKKKVGVTSSIENFLWIAFFAVPILGMVLRSLVGRLAGAGLTGGVTGAAAWFLFGSLIAGGVVAVLAFIAALVMGTNVLRQGRSGGGGWSTGGWTGGGGGGWSGGGGGGGFSGGGGGFDGGGASGDW